MSLRLRLTLVYSGMLSSVVLLLSIVVYALVSLLFTDFVDHDLQDGATTIISYLRADGIGGMELGLDPLPISDDYYYQIWSRDGRLLDYSITSSEFSSALDEDSLAQGELRFSEVTLDQVAYRVITVPLEVEGQPYGWLQVGLTLTDIRYTLGLLQVVFGISAMFAIVVSVMVGWIVIGQALSPLVTMADIAKQITSMDDLSQRIPVSAGWSGEIGELVLTFNQTFVRLERLFHTQRRFLADVSHELRTPLTVIKGNVGLMRLMTSYDEESLNSIEQEVNRLTRLVGDLLLMAQAEAGQLPLALEPVEIGELLFEISEEMKVISGRKHKIRIGEVEPAVVTGDRDRLKQVLLNLGVNAVNYTPEGGKIELSLGTHGDWVEIIVRDEGRGIPKEELGSVFERFYRGEKSRTRSAGSTGFGLGLPIAYWIVRSHGGRIDVETEVGQGTSFTVWLPRAQAEIPTRSQRKNHSVKR